MAATEQEKQGYLGNRRAHGFGGAELLALLSNGFVLALSSRTRKAKKCSPPVGSGHFGCSAAHSLAISLSFRATRARADVLVSEMAGRRAGLAAGWETRPGLICDAKAFFWVKLLAPMPRFVAQAATAQMMSGSDCAQV